MLRNKNISITVDARLKLVLMKTSPSMMQFVCKKKKTYLIPVISTPSFAHRCLFVFLTKMQNKR